MRFLLKPSRAPNAASTYSKSATKSNVTPKHCSNAWSQQCSSKCGCVLRFEVELSPPSLFTSSPTVQDASYHAKRVLTCNGSGSLKPLMTTHTSLSSRPILTTCTCPTLHQMAQQVVDYIPGKTIQSLKNETNVGVVRDRSSIPFRYTVLKEHVLPLMKSKNKKWTKEGNIPPSELAQTKQYFHCYDLVEETLLSLLHERQVPARKDSTSESFSSTMGGYFAIYSSSTSKQQSPLNDAQDESLHSTIHNKSDGWLRMAPSSHFLFGEDNATVSTLNHWQYTKDTIINLIFGKTEERKPQDNYRKEQRPTTTYLQLLDMYGHASAVEEEEEDDKLDDWVNYVDQLCDQSRTG